MKFYFLCCFLLFAQQAVFGQFEFGTPLIKGNLVYSVTEKQEEFCGKQLKTKVEKTEKYQSKLTGYVVWDLKEIERQKKLVNERGLQGSALVMNNYTDTRKEGEEWGAKVPLFPMYAEISVKEFGLNPCANTYECSDNYHAEVIKKSEFKGVASHHGKQEIIASCHFVGIEKTNQYLILGISAAGSWFDGGKFENSTVKGNTDFLTKKENTDNCEVFWKSEQDASPIILQSLLEEAELYISRDGKTEWTGSEGNYKRYTKAEEGISDECYEEIQLMKIDTGEFFKYVREKPAMKIFPFKGSYRKETINGNSRSIYSMEVSGFLTLGKQAEFCIEGANEKDFKEWLPGHIDFAGTNPKISIKASFSEDSDELDTLRFEIQKVSHLPGLCTNFPLVDDKNKANKEADMIIAPQDQQTDPNIIVINDSIAKTTKKVKSAVLVLQSRDFGAHAQVSASAITAGKKAESKYDSYFYLRVPYDANRNDMADQWESEMGLLERGCNKLDDNDDLPSDIDSKGDGLSVFEEYRGFCATRDVESSSDPNHTIRQGKHVRTSPLCRDVFIFDEDGLFAQYYEKENPAEVHWHLVNKDQMKVVQKQVANELLEPFEDGIPDKDDNSPKAQAQRKKLDIIADKMNELEEKGYRCINLNSPDTLCNNLQYGMHVLSSPVTNCMVGRTIDNAGGNPSTPLRNVHLVALPSFSSYKKAMLGVVNSLMLHTKHHALWEKYPQSVIDKVAELSFQAMVPHEIGHGLGITHHTKGSMTIVFKGCEDVHRLDNTSAASLSNRDDYSPMEKNYFDADCYLITSAQSAFWAMGVSECCMRYTTEREIDFQTGKVLLPSLKYCRRGQQFIDANGNKVDADGCFHQIKISCRKK